MYDFKKHIAYDWNDAEYEQKALLWSSFNYLL